MYNDIIEFGRIKYTKNEYGQEKETIEWREVYAEVTSVSRSEFYAAAMAYQNEKVVRYQGLTYDVIRTYHALDNYRLEITAEMRERDGNRTKGAE